MLFCSIIVTYVHTWCSHAFCITNIFPLNKTMFKPKTRGLYTPSQMHCAPWGQAPVELKNKQTNKQTNKKSSRLQKIRTEQQSRTDQTRSEQNKRETSTWKWTVTNAREMVGADASKTERVAGDSGHNRPHVSSHFYNRLSWQQHRNGDRNDVWEKT